MKPLYESIVPQTNTSFKVRTYDAASNCESTGWHIHPEYEIVYVKNGSGVLRIGNKIKAYRGGTLVFLGGNIPHSDFGNTQLENNREVVIQFSQEFVQKKLSLFPEFSNIKRLILASRQVLLFDDMVKKDLSSAFEGFESLDHQEKLVNLLHILAYLSNTSGYQQLVQDGPLHTFGEKESTRLKMIFEYINDNYNQKFEIRDIAGKVGLTPNSFSRFFKKTTNRTFIDFLNEFRIRKAADGLQEGDLTITEMMFRSGFTNPSYFTKQFVKYQGLTPSSFLKRESLL